MNLPIRSTDEFRVLEEALKKVVTERVQPGSREDAFCVVSPDQVVAQVLLRRLRELDHG